MSTEEQDDQNVVLLCSLDEKPSLEARNAAQQLQYIVEVVRDRGATELRESHILDLQRIAVDGIYPCGGTYRDARTKLTVGYHAPDAALVRVLVPAMLQKLADSRNDTTALDRAAFLLWRLNWIHPFRGGNGRTARAVTHLFLSMHHGIVLPGPLPSMILKDRDEGYIPALRAVDATIGDDGEADVSAMVAYLKPKLAELMAAFIAPIIVDSMFGHGELQRRIGKPKT